MIRLGVLLSGRGSNLLAIAGSIRHQRLVGVEIHVVLSNREDAPGLIAARELGIPAIAIAGHGRKRAEIEANMITVLREHRVDLVCLAGYMRLLSPDFVQAFAGRILNIHPSLLPAFAGLDAQESALAYGVKVAGCTVHFVDEQLDHGVIVLQRTVAVEDADTVETLSERILQQEHIAYTDAIERVVSGRFEVRGRKYLAKVPD